MMQAQLPARAHGGLHFCGGWLGRRAQFGWGLGHSHLRAVCWHCAPACAAAAGAERRTWGPQCSSRLLPDPDWGRLQGKNLDGVRQPGLHFWLFLAR